MNQRKLIAPTSLLLALAIFAWLPLSPREPVCGGKTISAWLTEQHRNAAKFDDRAIQSGIEAFNADGKGGQGIAATEKNIPIY